MVLKIGHSGKQIRNTLKVLKCGSSEGQRTSFGLIVRKMKKYHVESNRKGISHVQ
jgi:hypothetical protein